MKLALSALVGLMSIAAAQADNNYSNAVVSLAPVGYWPLNETTAPPPLFVASNSGTLGGLGNAYYNNSMTIPSGTSYTLSSLFAGNTPATGATSDGDTAAQFNGYDGSDGSGYILIPDISHALDQGTAFSAEAWVMPGGGDPNDPTGTSFACTEWAAIMKKGGGGAFYTENGDTNNANTYGWTVALVGKYCLGPDSVGWYEPGTTFLQSNACWMVDFYNGASGNSPSLEFAVPFTEPTPQWFHLVLSYDGTNANFYVNGALAATTVPGLPQSTNTLIAPGQSPYTSASGAYQFTTVNGVGYAPDTLNPIVLGNINETYTFINQGYPNVSADGTIGFNCQAYNGTMDEVAVYTNALSAASVLKHYQDASSANHTLYTNDVLSAAPPIYLRLDEPASSFVEPSDFTAFPVANNYGSQADANGSYVSGVVPGSPGPTMASGFGSQDYAAQINGFDAAVDVGGGALSGTALDPTGNQPISVIYWFKANPSDCYRRFQSILGRGDTAWRSSLDAVNGTATGGHIRWNPGNGPEIASPGYYNDGAWHFVAGVSDGTNAYLYLDGNLVTSAGGVGSLSGSYYDLLIGGAPDYTSGYGAAGSTSGGENQRFFAGRVAQVAFFTNALTAANVQALYNAGAVPAAISQNPQPLTIALGASGSLSVGAVGASLTYQWFQGTTPVSDVPGNISGSSTATLLITNALLSNGGNYTVVVTNSYASVTSSVVLVTIVPSPEILTPPPASTSVYTGNQTALSVSAIGAAPLAYQWYRAGSPIAGATASNVVVAAAAGPVTYTVVVTNTYGSATSSVVTVTGKAFLPPPTGLVVNFAVAPGSAASSVYNGQGAYSDPGHNVWNAFPGVSGTATGLAFDSASNQTLVTATLIFGFNNGAAADTTNGTPSYLLSYEDAVNTGSPGIGNSTTPEGQVTVSDLPQGTYSVYLYGANYDGNRGSTFTLAPVNGGAPDQGFDSTTNGIIIGTGAIAAGVCTFAESDNYVFFTNVVTDPFGDITVTYVPDFNPLSNNSGEAPFNGIQVAGVGVPAVSIKAVAGNLILTWAPASAVLESASTVVGPYSPVTGATSPYTNTLTGTQQFFRVKQ